MNKSKLRALAISRSILLTTGCSTLIEHSSKGHPRPFAGTALNVEDIFGTEGEGARWVPVSYGLIDFPFSLVADVIFLPYDIFVVTRETNK